MLVVGKTNIFKLDFPFDVFQFNSLFRIMLRFRMDQLVEPLEAGHPLLELLHKGDKLADGVEEHADKQHIGHKVPQGDDASEGEQPAQHQDHHVQQVDDKGGAG